MGTNQILILVVMAAAFYFLLIRPQQQQAKQQAKTVASLVPGTRIMTIGGIYATVVDVEDDRVRVSVADGSELEIAKRAVASILAETDDADVEEDEDVEDEPMLADHVDEEADAEEADAAQAKPEASAADETPADV